MGFLAHVAMRKLTFALACFVCACHERRKQASSHQLPGSTFQRKQDVVHAHALAQSLGELLLAFHPSVSMTRNLPLRKPLNQRSPLPFMEDTKVSIRVPKIDELTSEPTHIETTSPETSDDSTKVQVKIRAPSSEPALEPTDAEKKSPDASVKVRVRKPSEGSTLVDTTNVIATDDTTKVKITVKKPKPKPTDAAASPWEGWEGLTDVEQQLLNGARGNLTDLLLALQEGVNPNLIDKSGRTPLHYVAASGFSPAMVLMIHYGAQFDVQDKQGLTPLHMAAGYVKPRSLSVLIAAGADPNINAPGQGTAMDIVINMGEYQLEKFLKRTGVVEKMKKKDEKLDQLRECLNVFDNLENITKDVDWDEMVKEVIQVSGGNVKTNE